MRHNSRSQKEGIKYLLAGGSMLALVGVLTDLQSVFSPPPPPDVCQRIVQSQAVLSRDELSRLLTIPERSPRDAIQAIARDPYCLLPNIEIRAGISAEREVYPLAFDPQTWFVILYEGNEYAGYSFVFQR